MYVVLSSEETTDIQGQIITSGDATSLISHCLYNKHTAASDVIVYVS